MKEIRNYEDRSAVADAEAMSARLAEDTQKFGLFKVETSGIEKHSVRAANLGREMGLSFQEYYLPPKRELAEAWFNAHYRKALGMSYETFKWFIVISRKLADKPARMSDVMPAFQPALFAGELIALPQRTEAQVSHETTPFTYFFNALRGLQSDLAKRLNDAPQWDEQTRTSIVAEIERTVRFLGETASKIKALPPARKETINVKA